MIVTSRLISEDFFNQTVVEEDRSFLTNVLGAGGIIAKNKLVPHLFHELSSEPKPNWPQKKQSSAFWMLFKKYCVLPKWSAVMTSALTSAIYHSCISTLSSIFEELYSEFWAELKQKHETASLKSLIGFALEELCKDDDYPFEAFFTILHLHDVASHIKEFVEEHYKQKPKIAAA